MDNQQAGPNPGERLVASPDGATKAQEHIGAIQNEKKAEAVPQKQEVASEHLAQSSAVPTQPPVQVAPVLQPAQSPAPQTAPPKTNVAGVDPSNLPAEDSDLIEKEWVDTVDKVIEHTKDDPYTEEEAQQNLSRTYLKKRFKVDVD